MKKLVTPVLLLGIIAVGVSVFAALNATRQAPARAKHKNKVMAVAITPVRLGQQRAEITALGTVVPARSVTVLPEVSGRVVHVSPALVPGGRVRAGQVLVRIDPRDYKLAVNQQRANLAQARLALATEKGRKTAAEKEWALIRNEVKPTAEGKKLALHEIQLETAQTALASAQSALEQAQLRLSRTVIRAPFNALVTEELVDRGQVVGPQSRVATLVATDAFWVRLSIPVDELGRMEIPGVNAPQGSEVSLRQQGLSGPAHRGRVRGLLGEIDPRGKMARLLVEVPHPLGPPQPSARATAGTASRLPLLLGATVHARIHGRRVVGVARLPRRALHDGDRVWLRDGQGKLAVRRVQLLWAAGDDVVLRGPLHDGEQVVLSRLQTPVEGMALSVLPASRGGAAAATASSVDSGAHRARGGTQQQGRKEARQ